jgi:hypothetical protein
MYVTPAAYKAAQPYLGSSLLQLLAGGGPSYGSGTTSLLDPNLVSPITGAGGKVTGYNINWDALGQQGQYQPNPSDLVAPVTGTQQSLLDQLTASAAPGANYDAGQAELGKTIGGQYLTPDSNPFLQAYITAAQKSLSDAFSRQIVPDLLSRSTLRGQAVQGEGSSAFANAAANAANDYEQNLGNVATNIAYPAYAQERQNQLQAINSAQALSSAETQRLTGILQQAALPQLTADLGIQRGLEEYQRRVNVLLQALGITSGTAQPQIGNVSQSSSNSYQGGIGV